jgi:protein-disulfide isomerase/uncharacterized membrane protein
MSPNDTQSQATSIASAPRTPSTPRWPQVIRWVVFALAVLGWWLSLELYRMSAGALPIVPGLEQTCDGGSVALDCTAVLRSEYARVPLGDKPGAPSIPTAAFGMAYFAGVAVWFLFVGPARPRAWGWHALLIGALLIGAYNSAAYLHIMANVLQQWCVLCAVTHGINFLILLLTIVSFPWRRARAEEPKSPRLPLAGATLFAAVTLGLLHITGTLVQVFAQQARRAAHRYEAVITDPTVVIGHWRQMAAHDFALPGDRPLVGQPDARHTVVAFTDYQCSACRRAHQLLENLRRDHPEAIRIAYRHFPHNNACNPAWDAQSHAAACVAARAAEAAWHVGDPEAYARFSTLLFERQQSLNGVPFADWAAEVGIDRAAFEQAFQSDVIAARVRSDGARAEALGFDHGAPAIYLDGREVRYWISEAAWHEMLGIGAARNLNRSAPAPTPARGAE